MSERSGGFVWYELLTTDLEAAQAFYGAVLGWSLADAGMPGTAYTIARVRESAVGGLMAIPPEAAGLTPQWFGYVAVADVDAAAGRVTALGGAVHKAPADLPGIGRFAMVADPQGAVFVLFRGDGTPPPSLPYMTPGTVGWHELHAADWEKVYPFYGTLLGWPKDGSMDMGLMGTYQLLGRDGVDFGAMFSDGQASHAHWLYYFGVEDLDAAAARVADAGGAVTDGPHEVPGSMWIVHARDPQGAVFALVGPRPNA